MWSRLRSIVRCGWFGSRAFANGGAVRRPLARFTAIWADRFRRAAPPAQGLDLSRKSIAGTRFAVAGARLRLICGYVTQRLRSSCPERGMTYVVVENCIKCKYMDCVEVCPVDCFYEGENMLVIHPDECIDCGVCEPECPAEAIKPDTESGLEKWLEAERPIRQDLAQYHGQARGARRTARIGTASRTSSRSSFRRTPGPATEPVAPRSRPGPPGARDRHLSKSVNRFAKIAGLLPQNC